MDAVDSSASNDCNSGMGKGARSRLARKLRLLRVVHGWSQEDLANASGLHRTHISLIERSACSITLDNLEQLAESLNVSLPELLDATEPADAGKRMLPVLTRTRKKKRNRRTC
jgi:transcriptional regulator with XRE-family HTH domain